MRRVRWCEGAVAAARSEMRRQAVSNLKARGWAHGLAALWQASLDSDGAGISAQRMCLWSVAARVPCAPGCRPVLASGHRSVVANSLVGMSSA